MEGQLALWKRVCLFLALSLTGGAAFAQVTITYLTHWPPETVDRLEAAIERYAAENPAVRIEVRAVPFGNLLSTLRSQATSRSGPTITGIYELWLPELVQNGVADIAPDEYTQDITSNWPEGLLGSVTVADRVYGYPNEVNLYALNYNKRLFEEAGIDGPPETWDELVSYAERLTKRAGNTITQQGFVARRGRPPVVVACLFRRREHPGWHRGDARQ
jgi:multiple sugar transport system substrate-binding protein